VHIAAALHRQVRNNPFQRDRWFSSFAGLFSAMTI
jgi:hypothetical protein